jgi:pimeloyl-ACP methyl ester carboxylesterase
VVEPDSDHLKRWGRNLLLRAEPGSAARLLECYLDRPPLPLEELDVPALLLHGTRDAIVPFAVAEESAARLGGSPGARLVPVESAGHVPTVTRPELIARHIHEWVGGLDQE